MKRWPAALLGLWLLAPTLVGMWYARQTGAGQLLGSLGFALWLFALPLLVLGNLRRLFLFWMPVGLFVPLQVFLIIFFKSMPGDAVTASALHVSPAQMLEMVGGFGWLPLLLPAGWAVYILSWHRLAPLPGPPRKTLAAILLLYAMLGLYRHQWWSHHSSLPPLFEETVANASFPASTALSLWRVLGHDARRADSTDVIGVRSQPGPMRVILVIGESVRPDHLGLYGYARPTTPQLSTLGAPRLIFRDVSSSANYTYMAMPNIVRQSWQGKRVSIVSLFREAGFRTAWLSNQQSELFMPNADISDFSDNELQQGFRQDSALLPKYHACFQQCGPRQLMVLHLYGSHYPYDARYLAQDRAFGPTFTERGGQVPGPAFKEALIASYDNSLRATDRLLAELVRSLQTSSVPSVLLFTSDHGENLYDDERGFFMHIGPQPTRADTMVPLIIWANPAYLQTAPAAWTALQANLQQPASHHDILPTLASLGGLHTPLMPASDSLASPAYRPRPRVVAATSGVRLPVEQLK